MDETIKTWGQALDYTFRTRHSWRHGNGKKTSAINAGHFTRLRGRSFPLGKVTQPVISQVSIELEDEGKKRRNNQSSCVCSLYSAQPLCLRWINSISAHV